MTYVTYLLTDRPTCWLRRILITQQMHSLQQNDRKHFSYFFSQNVVLRLERPARPRAVSSDTSSDREIKILPPTPHDNDNPLECYQMNEPAAIFFLALKSGNFRGKWVSIDKVGSAQYNRWETHFFVCLKHPLGGLVCQKNVGICVIFFLDNSGKNSPHTRRCASNQWPRLLEQQIFVQRLRRTWFEWMADRLSRRYFENSAPSIRR